jgi:hypothetical protein
MELGQEWGGMSEFAREEGAGLGFLPGFLRWVGADRSLSSGRATGTSFLQDNLGDAVQCGAKQAKRMRHK